MNVFKKLLVKLGWINCPHLNHIERTYRDSDGYKIYLFHCFDCGKHDKGVIRDNLRG